MTDARTEAERIVNEAFHQFDDVPGRHLDYSLEGERALVDRIATALADAERRAVPPCGTCGGVPPSSGRPCVCGGVNTVYAEVQGLREATFDVERRARVVTELLRRAMCAEDPDEWLHEAQTYLDTGGGPDLLHELTDERAARQRAEAGYTILEACRHGDEQTCGCREQALAALRGEAAP